MIDTEEQQPIEINKKIANALKKFNEVLTELKNLDDELKQKEIEDNK